MEEKITIVATETRTQIGTQTKVAMATMLLIGLGGISVIGMASSSSLAATLFKVASITDGDYDNDGIADTKDNCSKVANGPLAGPNNQLDTNNDGFGNVCDGDLNNDGVVNAGDYLNFLIAFRGDADFNGDGGVGGPDFGLLTSQFGGPPGPGAEDRKGKKDSDKDRVPDNEDNCMNVPNSDQLDTNNDGFGNVCDSDLNNDGIVDEVDQSIFLVAMRGDADFDGGGTVNANDFNVYFLPQFKKGTPGPGAAEPSEGNPVVSIQTPNNGELLTTGQVYKLHWTQENTDRVIISLAPECSGCSNGILYDSDMHEIKPGELFKSSANHAVYYMGTDYQRYVFPNRQTYESWYSDFSGIKIISSQKLATIAIGGVITYRPGVKLVAQRNNPTIYAVDKNGTLRKIADAVGNDTTSSTPHILYGPNWHNNINVIPDAFFTNYTMGSPILSPSDFNPEEVTANSPTISIDKNLLTIEPDMSRISKNYQIVIPKGLAAGKEYKLKIQGFRENYDRVENFTDGYFIIVSNYNY